MVASGVVVEVPRGEVVMEVAVVAVKVMVMAGGLMDVDTEVAAGMLAAVLVLASRMVLTLVAALEEAGMTQAVKAEAR